MKPYEMMRWLNKWKLKTQMWTCTWFQVGMIWIKRDDKDDGGKSNVHINFLKCFLEDNRNFPLKKFDWKKKSKITSLNVS